MSIVRDTPCLCEPTHMKVTKNQKPPADFEQQLTQALRNIRIGDYGRADKILSRLRGYVPVTETIVPRKPEKDEYFRLRLATLLAEVADSRGDYDEARAVLEPYRGTLKELEDLDRSDEDLDLRKRMDEYRVVRQKLYYLWQQSVWFYRKNRFPKSDELLNLAIKLAERIEPRSETLLTQLYYGAGKLAFHEINDIKAIQMYRQSLMSASQRLDLAKHLHDEDAYAPSSDAAFLRNEVEAARYSVAKTLALGLAQCLREQGRLEEAHTQVVAGRLLLSLGPDRELSQYARLLLGSIERSIAGEGRLDILKSATDHVTDCAEYFKKHEGEVGHRSRLELALVTMQQKRLGQARTMLEALLKSTGHPKWVAECNLALSRVARRLEQHEEALTYARAAVQAAEGQDRIRRRAHTALVLALYDSAAATEDRELREERLKETLREIDRGLKVNPDVRTRANMLLTKARAHKLRGEIAQAIDGFNQYQPLKPLVEIGRIRELAVKVANELEPVMEFKCPADLDPPVYDLDENIEAVRHYVRSKVERTFNKTTEQAEALGRHRTSLYSKPNKPKHT